MPHGAAKLGIFSSKVSKIVYAEFPPGQVAGRGKVPQKADNFEHHNAVQAMQP